MLATIFAVWLFLAGVLAPVIGGFLRRNRRSYPKYPPLPQGSIERDWTRQ
jgi:hypothetical protein